MASNEDAAESSGQALERYIAEQLAGLKLSVPDDDVEFMARFVEEEGLEREEKVEGVRGMLEGVVEDGELPPEGVDDALGRVVDEWDRLRAKAERLAAEKEEEAAEPPTPEMKSPEPAMTEREIAKMHALKYAYVDGDPAELAAALEALRGDAPPRGAHQTEAEAKKAADERRALIEAALKLDGKKKKYKKQQDVDLMAPNLNREKVAYKAQMEREAAKNASQVKRDRDRAALEKQRADQAKAKADKQKKAAKQERRA